MSIFVVRHQHSPESCPAADFSGGAQLLNHLSRSNAMRHGVRIHGEAVLQGAHTLLIIAEADDERDVRAFFEPFAAAGTLEVSPASTCARVVASGGCASAMPTLDRGGVPAVDPEEACQAALDAGLVVHRAHPLNCETSIPALIGGVVMPNAHFYVRNHFQIPDLDASTWRLEVNGVVERPLTLSLSQLRALQSDTRVVTLECAGNGRSMLDPSVPGEQWGLGAVSTAEWTGVPLIEVLDRAGVKQSARSVVFRGADSGTVEGRKGTDRFERSLEIDQVGDAGALLAFAMNGEALPVQHGYPLRLIVPGWYAVASVKWLTHIEVTGEPFDGYFQVDKYHVDGEPVTLQHVRSLIVEPGPDQAVDRGDVAIRGVAWSGAAPIARVDVSVDGGQCQQATLVGDRHRHRWQWWELATRFEEAGVRSVRARATDLAGRVQPDRGRWNRLGYGNNAIQEARITVRS